MFEFVFPIFCFGVVITGVVVKGLVMAADRNRSQLTDEASLNSEEQGVVQTVTSLAEKLVAS